MELRPLAPTDHDEWLRLRALLWPESGRDQLSRELGDYLSGAPDKAVFVAVRREGGLGGFIELSIRRWAAGCDSEFVGYIEGWFVDADVRRQHVGASLVATGEAWARSRGCTEMASDTELENRLSQEAHGALGYRVTERLVAFAKRIG